VRKFWFGVRDGSIRFLVVLAWIISEKLFMFTKCVSTVDDAALRQWKTPSCLTLCIFQKHKRSTYAVLLVFNHVVYLRFLITFLAYSKLISIEQPKVFPSWSYRSFALYLNSVKHLFRWRSQKLERMTLLSRKYFCALREYLLMRPAQSHVRWKQLFRKAELTIHTALRSESYEAARPLDHCKDASVGSALILVRRAIK
jgi:hypothetical protein